MNDSFVTLMDSDWRTLAMVPIEQLWWQGSGLSLLGGLEMPVTQGGYPHLLSIPPFPVTEFEWIHGLLRVGDTVSMTIMATITEIKIDSIR